jgi:hypothetical protein
MTDEKETQNPNMLNRDEARVFIKQYFQDQLDVMEELVNYGTHLMPRCFTSSDKGITDAIIIFVLVKHIVEMLDATHILLIDASVLASYLQARSMLESGFYLEYILEDKDKTETRAKHYYVWNQKKHLFFSESSLERQKGSKGYLDELEETTEDQEAKFEQARKHAQDAIDQITKILKLEEFKAINQEFNERLKKRPFPKWFSLEGINSIRQLADHLGHLSIYDILYSQMSDVTHGTSMISHMVKVDGKLIFEPLRNPKSIDTLINVTTSSAIGAYLQIIEKYRSAERKLFVDKYLKKWKKPLDEMKEVEKKDEHIVEL